MKYILLHLIICMSQKIFVILLLSDRINANTEHVNVNLICEILEPENCQDHAVTSVGTAGIACAYNRSLAYQWCLLQRIAHSEHCH